MPTTTTATVFDTEQSWIGFVNFPPKPWPLTTTGFDYRLSRGALCVSGEILEDAYWSAKVQRGLGDSAADRVRSLDEYLNAV